MTGTRLADEGDIARTADAPQWVDRALERLMDATERNTLSISNLQEITRSHSDAISELRGRPANTRAWLSIAIAALGGCLIPVVLTTAGLALTAVGILVQVLTTHH